MFPWKVKIHAMMFPKNGVDLTFKLQNWYVSLVAAKVRPVTLARQNCSHPLPKRPSTRSH